MAISRDFRAMLDAATERSRQADLDWSKNPDGIDFTPSRIAARQSVGGFVPFSSMVSDKGKDQPECLPDPNPHFGTW